MSWWRGGGTQERCSKPCTQTPLKTSGTQHPQRIQQGHLLKHPAYHGKTLGKFVTTVVTTPRWRSFPKLPSQPQTSWSVPRVYALWLGQATESRHVTGQTKTGRYP